MWEKIHTHKKYMYFSPDVENNVWKYVKKKLIPYIASRQKLG